MSKLSYVYSEVYSFINALGDEYKNKIPEKIYRNFEQGRDKSYNPKYNANEELKEGEISKFALTFVLILYTNYWCESTSRKEEILKKIKNNAKK
jgi:hypothetical protein